MDLEEGTIDGSPRDSPPLPGARGRACLVLSLIVLVWNLGVTARDAFFASGPGVAGFILSGTGAAVSPEAAGGDRAGTAGAAGGRPGALSVRQRFLLGETVDINSAGWERISGLPGISDAVARAVVERRRLSGPFGRPQELLNVPGIKARRLEKMLPFLSGFPNN